jgi:hypothetical protein
MVALFEYGTSRIQDMVVRASSDPNGNKRVQSIELSGRPVQPTKRFWKSLHLRFGFTENIFRYFSHDEVFERISRVAPNDRIRWCIQKDENGDESLLGVSNPTSPLIPYDEVTDLLRRYDAEEVKYANGMITSRHATRAGDAFMIAGDDYRNKYMFEIPIDGFGKPAIFLSLLRLICSNGAVGYNPAFRSELNVGRGNDRIDFAIIRALEGFNNEEGFSAMRQRFEAAANSWASVYEVQRFYHVLVNLHNQGLLRSTKTVRSNDRVVTASDLIASLNRLAGDFSEIYGLANLDALTHKRQRTLPSKCKVYELINFASETATHHVDPTAQRRIQAYIGELVANEYDLEGTADRFSDWSDFFIGHAETTNTLASLHRRRG